MIEKREAPRDGGERRLLEVYRTLGAQDRTTLAAFAEFLALRGVAEAPPAEDPLEPEAIPRPREESVVGAIKRLSRSYYMLDRRTMLNETSSLMGAHVLQGRPAVAVIDELESLFAREYVKYREDREQEKG